MHIFAALAQRAAAQPEAIFCHFLKGGETQAITVGALMAEAAAIAGRLRAFGATPGAVVPIVLEHRPALYTTFIGCSLAGLAPTLLAPLTHKQHAASFRDSTRALLARIDPPCVIVSAATRPMLDLAGRPALDVDETAETQPLSASPRAAPHDIACLQHSSGTTGLKKGVALSHAAILAQVENYAAAISLRSEDRIASWLPLYHDMGLITAFLLPAILAVPVVHLDALEWSAQPTLLLDAIEQYRATLCWLPNFAFHHIARNVPAQRAWDLSSLRMTVNCSEPCREAAFAAFRHFVPPDRLQASYAMAETVFAVTQTAPGRAARRSPHPQYPDYVSSGAPIGGMAVAVRDSDGVVLPDGRLGEIHVAGDSLFGGYYRDDALTAARLRDGWYATGDLGFLDGGELFVVGRGDDVLNVNGRKIVAHDIEDALALVPGVAPGRALVWAQHDADLGAARIAVAAERAPAAGIDDAAIVAALRRAVLAACAQPAHGVTLLERGFLAKSTSGKLARAASLARLRAAGLLP